MNGNRNTSSTIAQAACRQRGWSLIESMVGAAVASVMASVAVPNMVQFKESAALAGTTNELMTALHLAKSEAITRQSRVVVSPVSGSDWRSGWNVYVDRDNDGSFDESDLLVQQYAPRSNALAVSTHFGATSDGSSLSFAADGSVRRAGSNGLMIGRLVLRQGGAERAVCVHTMRIRTVKASTCS